MQERMGGRQTINRIGIWHCTTLFHAGSTLCIIDKDTMGLWRHKDPSEEPEGEAGDLAFYCYGSPAKPSLRPGSTASLLDPEGAVPVQTPECR